MNTEISRRRFLKQSLGMVSLLSVQGFCKDKPQKSPNIVLFLADDLGCGDVGCYGSKYIKTPNIDKLADEGVKFTAFYSNGPECSPTRTALLTGRYQQRVGGLECAIGIGNVGRYDDAIRLRKTNDLGLPVSETSIARMLKSVNYNTGVFGKWHLGYDKKFSPKKHGFDQSFYVEGGGVDYFHHVEPPPSKLHFVFKNEKPVDPEGYMTDIITSESLNFINDQTGDNPFFLYVPYTAPHSPYQGPDDYQEKPLPDDSDLWKQGKAPKSVYAAMVEHMDKSIGTIIRQLDEKKLLNNTLIIFMSDNGANKSGSNAQFRGFKGHLFEGGIRVPCIVKWPGVLPSGRVSHQPCMTMDFSASIVQIAGAHSPRLRSFDGMDIILHVREQKSVMHRTLFWRAKRGNRTCKAVRDGDMKYMCESDNGKISEYCFDLKKDPSEKDNLINNKVLVDRLKEKIHTWEVQVKPVR